MYYLRYVDDVVTYISCKDDINDLPYQCNSGVYFVFIFVHTSTYGSSTLCVYVCVCVCGRYLDFSP